MKNLKFWIKTKLYQYFPGGWGYYRRIRLLKDRSYDHEKHKHLVRRKHFGKEGWNPTPEDGVLYRDYSDYDEYKTHQIQKFNELIRMGTGFTNSVVGVYRKRFYRRFRTLSLFLNKDAKILCAGARQGTEVEVLRDLGYHNAIGIDLNPGPFNELVKEGDFMNLAETDDSIDLIYSNAVDHAFELEGFFREHARVLKPNGFAIYDLSLGGTGRGVFESVSWNSDSTVYKMMLQSFSTILKVETERDWQWILLSGPVKENGR